MNSKIALLSTLLLLSAVMFTSPVLTSSSSTEAVVTVNPKKIYVPSRQQLTINITVCNVTDLNAWQLRLAFNPLIVNCTNVMVPRDNIFGASYILFPPKINNAEGYVLAFCALDGIYGVSGSGVLCQIEFSCLMPGIGSLEITKESGWGTYLQEPDYDLIPFEAVDGTVAVTEQSFEESLFNVTINGETCSVLIFSSPFLEESIVWFETIKLLS